PAAQYPAKTVKIIVGTSPGGSPDVFARLIAQKMSESWGPVVIENRIGANGNIAAEMVSKSAPDGYTAYVCDSAIWAINPHLYAKVPYRPLADFAGISTISTLPTFLTVHPSVPATTYAEFGIPAFDLASMLGALVPAGVPRDIVAKLNAGVVAAVASPEVHDKIAGFGVRIGTSTPEQFDALMRAEYDKYAKLVKLSGAKLD